MTVSDLSASSADRDTSLTLWYTRCQLPSSFSLALQFGLFDTDFPAHGPISLMALQDAPDKSIAQSHFTHAQPNSFRHGSNLPALWAQANGANTRVIGLSSLRAAQRLMVRPDSPIESVADLRGRRLLVPRRPHEPIDYLYANTLRLYAAALATAGLTLDDVELVERVIARSFTEDRVTQSYGANGTVVAKRSGQGGLWEESVFPLLSGAVDVITSGGNIGAPPLQFAFLLGLRTVFDMAEIDDEVARANNSSLLVFAVKADLLDARPELVERVLRRSLEAAAQAEQRADEALRCIAREQSTAEHLAVLAWRDRLADSLRISFAPSQIEALHAQADYLHRLGLIERSVDVDAWLEPRLLDALRA